MRLHVDARLGYSNLFWETTAADAADRVIASALAGSPISAPILGQFALAEHRGDAWYLIRDRLGVNKLFYVLDEQECSLRISSSLFDLAPHCHLSAIRSVAPGHVVRIDETSLELRKHCYDDISEVPALSAGDFDVPAFQERVRLRLRAVFDAAAAQFPAARFVVCLSGGLDSTIVAAFARRYLPNAAAATFSYAMPGGSRSDDFLAAQKISQALGLEHIPVLADRAISLPEVDEVLRACQDWRDFNVHCAWVNAMISRGLRQRFPRSQQVVLLTGDLMNEYLADYAPVVYQGVEYYPQPNLGNARRRRAFIFGLDTSDREVGVFHRDGFTTIQPYAAVADAYVSVPAAFLDRADRKEALNLALIGNRDAESLVTKTKVRAQVGGSDGGTLGLFHDAGITQAVLRQRWDALVAGVTAHQAVGSLIVAGRYRS